jgi:predicted MFS family arabinose efflux permease
MVDAEPPYSGATYPGYGSRPYRAYVLFALLAVYTFNFIDRVLLGVLQEAIKRDIGVSDFQLGLLGGPAFAIFQTLMGIPIARHAERRNRITIVAIGAAVWSAMTALCGFAGNIVQLAAARIGVGIGEAACTPPSHSVISDYFPASRRASALSIWGLGVPIGTTIAALGGGWFAAHMDWRVAFWMLGAPGLLIALCLKLTVREPPRSGPPIETPTFGETLATLLRKPTFWHVSLGAALVSFVGYSTGQFLVSHFIRSYGLGIEQASYAFAAIAGISAGAGTFLGGFLCDRLSHRYPRIHGWLPALGILVAAPLYLLSFSQQEFAPAFALLMAAPLFSYFFLGPTLANIQSIAPPRMRATAIALVILIINLIGYALGPPSIGALSDHFANQSLGALGLSTASCEADQTLASACAPGLARGLRSAMTVISCVLFWPVLHFWFAGRTLLKDRVA